jgi:hypothetical protein
VKQFRSPSIYINHYQEEHGSVPPEYINETLFFCENCPKAYLSKTQLTEHIHKVHHSKKPVKKKQEYLCEFYDKKFKEIMSLKEHVLSDHEKITPFQFEHCLRSFGLKSKLNTHIGLVHQRIKCSECGQETCNSFELKRHKAKVHGIKPKNAHQCKYCPLFYKSEVYLANHVAKVHPEA